MGSGFYCLRSCFFFLFLLQTRSQSIELQIKQCKHIFDLLTTISREFLRVRQPNIITLRLLGDKRLDYNSANCSIAPAVIDRKRRDSTTQRPDPPSLPPPRLPPPQQQQITQHITNTPELLYIALFQRISIISPPFISVL